MPLRPLELEEVYDTIVCQNKPRVHAVQLGYRVLRWERAFKHAGNLVSFVHAGARRWTARPCGLDALAAVIKNFWSSR